MWYKWVNTISLYSINIIQRCFNLPIIPLPYLTKGIPYLVLVFVNRSQSIKINVTASLFTKYYIHGSLMPSIFKESHSKEAFSARVVLLDTIVFRVAMRFLPPDRWSKKNSKRREKKAAVLLTSSSKNLIRSVPVWLMWSKAQEYTLGDRTF